jgi:hypothetical protein
MGKVVGKLSIGIFKQKFGKDFWKSKKLIKQGENLKRNSQNFTHSDI